MPSSASTRSRLYAIGRIGFVSVLVFGVLAFGASSAFARTFDPTLVISDANMRAYDSMSASQIQAFLNGKRGPLKRMSFQRHDNGSVASAAVIIWEASQAWHISPKVLLAMLQKEQSLLTRKSLAAHTLQRAVGAGCPDSGGCKYPGFGNQIWNGARMLDGYGEAGKTTPYVPLWTPGLTNRFTGKVHTNNLATYKLYVYNPSIGAKAPYGDLSGRSLSGNANFWKIYWSYFGNPFPVVTSQQHSGSGECTATITLDHQYASRGYSEVATLSGKLVSADATYAPVTGAQVSLEKPVGSSWVPIADTAQTVGADGSFAFALSARSTQRVRVVFAGAGAVAPAVSGCFVAEAVPVLSTPSSRSILSAKSKATISGTLSPAHRGKVRVGLYHRTKGAYRLWKTLSLTASRAGVWKLHVKVPRGSWRFKASHVDAGHALGTSGWCYATVK